ncbi:TAF6-like RNA polymerase II p300/CBP-associated factor-associated factor 65 kDa subunit 6L [Pseudonaja textilis]|uniref:TAF6-like RNA polymerase II p300/CBP-associated factor-associated factor 65 kDa subunit 6L n=1 Tax=Pseudonaja textilis TaxID=8673 RepID=UPI000EAA0838|nr:TAF6-like RNA polymerase II p300/CBP-associated factor-associated factor 65 kDa subunit 6L [Pseudonaja textilis]
MSEREERRFVEIPRESVRLMAESAGVELTDEVAALLAEDVCYRLREATQVVCGHGSPDPLPFRAIKEGELYFQEDREVNLVEVALATSVPKDCAETAVRVHVSYLDGKGNLEAQGSVPSAVSMLTDDLLKYYQHVTRAVLGDDPQLMKVALQDLQTNSKIAALLPYFVYIVSGVKSVSHDLEQLNRLLHMAKSLIQNPYLCLGSYVKSLIASVMYCVLEPLAASINPLNDHWTLRDYAALLLGQIFWTHGDLVSSLYHQILLTLQKVLADPVRPLCSHYGAVVGLHALGWEAVQRVLYPHLSTYWSNLQVVLDDYSVSNAQVKADGHKVYGAILVAVERLLKMKAQSLSVPAQAEGAGSEGRPRDGVPWLSPLQDAQVEFGFGIASHLLQLGSGVGIPPSPPAVSLNEIYQELYYFFGDSLATRFGTGAGLCPAGPMPASPPKAADTKKEQPAFGGGDAVRKMPQLTASATVSPREEESPRVDFSAGRPALHRSASLARSRSALRQQGHRPVARDVFQKCRFSLQGPPHFSFVIAGRQVDRRCQGRLFQTSFLQHHGPTHVSRYAQKLPMIGRTSKPTKKWGQSDYSLYLPL